MSLGEAAARSWGQVQERSHQRPFIVLREWQSHAQSAGQPGSGCRRRGREETRETLRCGRDAPLHRGRLPFGQGGRPCVQCKGICLSWPMTRAVLTLQAGAAVLGAASPGVELH